MTDQPKRNKKRATAETVWCPTCKNGVLFNTTPRLAEAQGKQHRRCDRCAAQFVFNVTTD